MKKGLTAILSLVLLLCMAVSASAFAEPYQTGDTILLGSYEQDNDTADGAEPIEWIVLDTGEDGSLTLLSKYALDVKPYNASYVAITWENSTLRAWLNEDFLNTAFTVDEQEKLLPSTVKNEDHPESGTEGGNDTQDRVYLLSIDEACDYYSAKEVYSIFTDNASRMCVPTAYAIAQGALVSASATNDDSVTCWWWLRSIADYSGGAMFVNNIGIVTAGAGYGGNRVSNDMYCIRPVIRILP